MEEFLLNLSTYSILLPFLTGLLLWRFQDANARIMIILLAFATLPQLSSKLGFSRETKITFYNCYILMDILLWGFLFLRNTRSKRARAMIVTLCLVLVTYSILIFTANGTGKLFFSYLVSLNSIIQVICVLIYFYEKYSSEIFIRLVDDSMFWFCFGILVYAPLTYFMFAFRFYVPNKELANWWNYHHVINTILYLIITAGMLVPVKKTKLSAL
jgi:hypothetical protein